MTRIRPVTQRCPSSADIWEETGLPLSCVVTPLGGVSSREETVPPRPLTSIPKCLHCGSPHFSKTSFFQTGYDLFCKLCFKRSSMRFEDQADHRLEEKMNPHDYPTAMGLTNPSPSGSGEFALSVFEDSLQIPAVACPPIWWLVIDGTCSSNAYWSAVQQAVSQALETVPSHVHIGLMVLNSLGVGVWDLTSPVPHVKNYSFSDNFLDLDLVPATAVHLSNLQAALRALGDTSSHSQKEQKAPQLGLAIQAILDSMQNAFHPGLLEKQQSILKYAGGKIMCFLSGPPKEIGKVASRGSIGTGGMGGSCAQPGHRFSAAGDPGENDNSNNDDMTPSNLNSKNYEKGMETLWDELGQECAEAALGVDILALLEKPANIGLPYLRLLADRSGAAGPLLFSIPDNINNSALCREVLARTPWHRPMAFGALLRVRLSPGLGMDTATLEDDTDKKVEGPHLVQLYGSGGLIGPGSLANGDDDDSNLLWRMGSCDATSTVTLDLEISGKVKDQVYLEGFGNVAIKPCVQTCFAYTMVIQNQNGEWVTVRRMRVDTLPMSLAGDTETLYSSLDPEALAVVLFHKLTITSLRDGVMEAQVAGQYWLVTLLVCAYRSAKVHAALVQAQASRGLVAPKNDKTTFFANERLLDGQGGQLSKIDVLLAQGHDRLCTLPLLVFSLLQCDALRPSMGFYLPTMDARCAASAQMYSMTPSVLSRCIAPRLELWPAGQEVPEPIMEHVDLCMERLQMAVREHEKDGGTTDSNDLVLLLDSPRLVMVLNCQNLAASKRPSSVRYLTLSEELKSSIDVACKSYRAPPPVVYALQPQASGDVSPISLLSNALVEDSVTVDGLDSFQQWKSEIAGIVHEEIKKEGI